MPFDQSRWDDIVSKWEEDQPGVSDVETPPETPMVLPEMDLSAEPDADDMGGPSDNDADNAGGEMVLPEMDLSGPSKPPPAPQHLSGPVSVAPKPKAPVESLDWKGLSDRLALAEMNRGQSKAYESLFANVGARSGYRPNAAAGDAALAIAKQPLELAQAKQGMEARDLSMQSQKREAGVKAAMDDPNSLQSQKARDAIRSFFPEQQMPAGFDSWSANDVQKFANSGTLAKLADDRRAAGKDAAKAQMDAEKAAAATKDLEGSRTAFANELKDLGIDPTKASQKDIDRAISVRHAKATEKMAQGNFAIAKSNEDRKKGDYAALGEGIPFAGGELKYSGGGTPREDDRREAQKVASSWNAALSGMDDLEGSLRKFATSPGIDSKRDVESKVRVVSAALNSAVGGGAMSEAEALAMAKALGADVVSPSGIEAALMHLIGDDPKAAQVLLTRLQSVRQSSRATALGKLKTYRYGMPDSGSSDSVRMSNGKETRMVPRKYVEAARADGYSEVQ